MTMSESPTLAPPAATPSPGAPGEAPAPAPRRASSRVVATIAICAGGALLVGTVAAGVVSIVRAATVRTETLTASASGIRGLDLDLNSAAVTVEYADIAEATLRVRGGSGADDWTLVRDGDRLVVDSDRDWWGRWGWFREGDTVELTLPRSLEGADADIEVNSGSLRARGDFGALVLELGAGSLTVSGSADAVTTDISAGSARLDLDGVREADLTVSAGSLDGRLTGDAPASVFVDVSAGRLDLTVPDASYALTSDVSAGTFRHDLSTDPRAPQRIDVRLSAGAVVIDTER
jgi:hypothetical protein